jgi:hypothetical protein
VVGLEKGEVYEMMWKVFKNDLSHHLNILPDGESKNLALGLIEVMDYLENGALEAMKKPSK